MQLKIGDKVIYLGIGMEHRRHQCAIIIETDDIPNNRGLSTIKWCKDNQTNRVFSSNLEFVEYLKSKSHYLTSIFK